MARAHKLGGELKLEAAFDHAKHYTDALHTLDGEALKVCVECHHTELPKPSAKPYLKRFDRKDVLTVATNQHEDVIVFNVGSIFPGASGLCQQPCSQGDRLTAECARCRDSTQTLR